MPTNVADAGVAIRGDLKPFLKDVQQTGPIVESLGKKLDKALSPRALSANAFGKGPDELARSFGRAADSADEAFESVRKLGTQNIDTAKARKYAGVLEEISIEAQQTLADLRQLQKTDPRFDTPQMKAAADQLDRVGREAAESARSLNDIRGVGASTEFERMAHEAREAGTALETTGKRTDGLFGKLKGLKGALVGLGLAVGAQQLLSFAGDAVQTFSDLEQAVRSVDTIFGTSAGVIEDWSGRAAEAAGLSRREVNESAAQMGQTLLNMGYNAQEAAGMVVTLQQRAADLALAFGKKPQDAILAISSVLRGERDTIEKFGVSIKQVDVNARVAALGLDTSTDAAKKNSEAVATLDLVLQQTANSAGRFANETDSVAVNLAQMAADAENGKAKLGELAATVETSFFKNLDVVSDQGEAVGDWIYEMKLAAAVANDTGVAIARDMGIPFDEFKDRVIRNAMLTGDSLDEVVRRVQHGGDLITEEGRRMVTESGKAWDTYQEQIRVSGTKASDHVSGFVGTIVGEMQAGRIAVVDIALRTPGEIAQAYEDGRDAVEQASLALADALENGMSDTDRVAYLQGQLTTDQLQEGLNSKIPEARARAIALREVIMAELWMLEHRSYVAGAAIPLAMARGIYANAWNAEQAAARLAAGISGFLPSSEPKNPNSALRGITTMGAGIVDMIAGGIYGSLGTAEGASAALASVLSPSIPVGSMPGGGGGMPSQVINNYTLSVEGKPITVDGPQEMVDELMQVWG